MCVCVLCRVCCRATRAHDACAQMSACRARAAPCARDLLSRRMRCTKRQLVRQCERQRSQAVCECRAVPCLCVRRVRCCCVLCAAAVCSRLRRRRVDRDRDRDRARVCVCVCVCACSVCVCVCVCVSPFQFNALELACIFQHTCRVRSVRAAFTTQQDDKLLFVAIVIFIVF